MNIRVYLYWGNTTNTNMSNIQGPFYSNNQKFKYLNIHAHHFPQGFEEAPNRKLQMEALPLSGYYNVIR